MASAAMGVCDPAVQVQAEDGARERAVAMIKAELAFQPSVFSGEEFPDCEFLQPGEIRKWIGDYTFEVGALTREIAEAYEKLVRA